jgi:hypothetical protein
MRKGKQIISENKENIHLYSNCADDTVEHRYASSVHF